MRASLQPRFFRLSVSVGALGCATLLAFSASAQIAPAKSAAASEAGPKKAEASKKSSSEPKKAEASKESSSEPKKAKDKPADKEDAKETEGSSEKPEAMTEQAAAAGEAADSDESPVEDSAAEAEEDQPQQAEQNENEQAADESEQTDADSEEQDDDDEEPDVDYSKFPWTYHLKHIDLAAGIGFSRAAHDGLAPFLEKPLLVEGFVRPGIVVWSKEPLSLAASLEFGGSRGSATVRDWDSQVSFMHIGAGIEPRYYLLSRLALYGRIMVGAEHSRAIVSSYTFGSELSDGDWGVRADGNLGLSLRLVGSADGRKRGPRFWIFAEGGYRYSSNYKLELQVDEDDGPARPVAVSPDPYSSRGIRGAIGIMGSY